MRFGVLQLFVASALALAACGGKVVVDGNNAGGGYTGGTGGGTGGTSGSWTGYCMNAPDMSALTFCGASTGTEGSCIENDFCDAEGNVWSAICSSQACSCQLNGATVCTCLLSTAGDFCTTTPTCCPTPKL